MKVVILAGGFGTRLSEYTSIIPKPMLRIGDKPIIEHIMNIYSKFGLNDFYLALGYKAEVVKDYFYKYQILNSDFKVDLRNGSIKPYQRHSPNWSVSLIDTGKDTMTGGRLLRLKEYIKDETFLLTYGDAVTDLNINNVLNYHKKHGKLITVTAVRPTARFGELKISKDNSVSSFREKPQLMEGWINGGYFVIEPEFLDYISNDQTILEKEPLEKAASDSQLMAYLHEGYWHCVDTKRDKDTLDDLVKSGRQPW
ncbi:MULTISPECIES: glucose-1-phosphate cytidylyltransferase [Prochlorococcus]|uniref:glucose-1-phosphate cytidylyltransferase n=1 Tax=Prochlorococcus TaxID=1218 RepID=UPI00053383C5|nr:MULTISPECIES: glucose-1-phosphate cytidylyltransferase [Prochlorococcus]KGG12038.1 Glucose-1-phosphate cytidylyltransferase [Prochlorococcus sp. MIT 0601]